MHQILESVIGPQVSGITLLSASWALCRALSLLELKIVSYAARADCAKSTKHVRHVQATRLGLRPSATASLVTAVLLDGERLTCMPASQCQWHVEEIVTNGTSCMIVKRIELLLVWAFRPLCLQVHHSNAHHLPRLAGSSGTRALYGINNSCRWELVRVQRLLALPRLYACHGQSTTARRAGWLHADESPAAGQWPDDSSTLLLRVYRLHRRHSQISWP